CVTAAAAVTVDGSNGPFAGRVYVTYGDGNDVFVAAFDPALRPLTRERVDPAPSDRFLPSAAVDSSDGRLWVCFYDTGADRSRARARYACTSSRDGGRCFGHPVSAASVASDETGPSANRVQYGDYEGLAVVDGLAHPIWTDSRDLR